MATGLLCSGRKLRSTGPPGGFTLIEVITVLVILGLISGYLFTNSAKLDGTLPARLSEMRAQLRFVQLTALQGGVSYVGLKCDGAEYWAQYSNATYILLPGESGQKVSLSAKSIQTAAFDIEFDKLGIPYDGTSMDKLTAPASISITAAGATGAISVAPETGFAQ
jgi:MSHA pilin protein MshC